MKLFLFLFLLFPSLASALTIGVGQAGRGYENFGLAMVERLPGSGIQNFEGSDDISQAVCDGVVDAGIMQIDAIRARALENCKLRVVGVYGSEFAYLLVPPGSNLDGLDDFNSTTKILIDTIGSGTDLFWQTVLSIETGKNGNNSSWSKAKGVNDPTFIAQTMAETGEIDAVLVVAKPNSTDLKELIDAGWDLIQFYDKDINDEMFNGEELYPVGDASIAGTGGWLSGDKSSSSYAIRSFIVLGDTAAKDRKVFADTARAAKAVAANR